MTDEGMTGGYARRVGDRLRAIRKQKGLSLQEVEASSSLEFKASVLGAYERGERAISVPRLQRLARFYNVPVDQLLPRDVDIDLTDGPDGDEGDVDTGTRHRTFDAGDKITIDLTRFQGPNDDEARVLHRYVNTIQVQRQDFNGRMLTIRRDDIRAIAAAAGLDVDALVRRLDDLQLRKS
ncbi:MAG TPA: helix-turn-helix domain-containing protein [Acidimicrobiia bacterium]|nr:helix-turn-helix domain-containing protein [Acidimicrobiia bacterium]